MALLGQRESTVLSKLQMWSKKPSLDIDLSGVLDKFLQDLNTTEEDLPNGVYTNFAEAALVLQNSVELYGKKVDILWSTAFNYSKRINEYETKTVDNEGKTTRDKHQTASDVNPSTSKECDSDGEENEEPDSDSEEADLHKGDSNIFTTILEEDEAKKKVEAEAKKKFLELQEKGECVEISDTEEMIDEEQHPDVPYIDSEKAYHLYKARKFRLHPPVVPPIHTYELNIPSVVINEEEDDEDDNRVCLVEDLCMDNPLEKLKQLRLDMAYLKLREREFKEKEREVWSKFILRFPQKWRIKFRKDYIRNERRRMRLVMEQIKKARSLEDLEKWLWTRKEATEEKVAAFMAAYRAQNSRLAAKALLQQNDSNNNFTLNAGDGEAEPHQLEAKEPIAAEEILGLTEIDIEKRRPVVEIKRMSMVDVLKYSPDHQRIEECRKKAVVEIRRLSTEELIKYSQTDEFHLSKEGYEASAISSLKRKTDNLLDDPVTPRKKGRLSVNCLLTAKFEDYEQFYYFNYQEYQDDVNLNLSQAPCSLHSLERFIIKKEKPDSECGDLETLDFQGFDLNSSFEDDSTAMEFSTSSCRSCCQKQCFPSENIRACDFDVEQKDFMGFDTVGSSGVAPLLDESGNFPEVGCTSCCHRMLVGPDFLNENSLLDPDEDFDFGSGGCSFESGYESAANDLSASTRMDSTMTEDCNVTNLDSSSQLRYDSGIDLDTSLPLIPVSGRETPPATEQQSLDEQSPGASMTRKPQDDFSLSASELVAKKDQEEWVRIRKAVREWKAFILPKLKRESSREVFDIHKYGSEIMDAIPSGGGSVNFLRVASGKPADEVARYFAALLQLVNTGNIAVSQIPPGELMGDRLEMELLTRDRYHEHLVEYEAPSSKSRKERLSKAKR